MRMKIAYALLGALWLFAGGIFTVPVAHGASDVLVVGKAEDPRTLDPAVTMANNAWTVTYPVYQRLVRYQTKDGKGLTTVEGELAKSWTVSPDGLVWTFTLRGGQKFDDGTPVTAQAVKFSFDRLLAIKQGPADAFPSLVSVDALNDTTVKFTLSKPFAPFLYTLANDGAAIVNPKIAAHEVNGDRAQGWLSVHSAGSGAYRVASWEKGQSIVLEPNPHYGEAKPSFSKVIFKMIGEASARRLQLESGDIDIAENLPNDQLDALQKNPGVHVGEYPSLSVTYLYLNNKKGALANRDVREAISYAIDYKGIIDGILSGQAEQMRGPIPDGMWGHDKTVHQFTHNVAKAKALLKKSGVNVSKLGYLYATRDPNWEPIGLAVQANLADIGIKVDMENLAYATMRDRLGKGDFDIAIGNWAPDFSDPYMYMNYWFDSARLGLPGNRSFYVNPKVDALIRKAATQTKQSDRLALYQKAQKIVVDDAAYVYLFQKNARVAMRADLKGFVYNPMLDEIYNIATMHK